MSSDTPRTDAETISGSEQIAYLDENGLRCTTYHFVTVEFARTLERENAALTAELAESARLHAMGSEREARLRARVAELERDAGRFRTFGAKVGAEKDARGRQQFTYPDIEDSRVDLMQGSVYQHWCAAIDAAMRGRG